MLCLFHAAGHFAAASFGAEFNRAADELDAAAHRWVAGDKSCDECTRILGEIGARGRVGYGPVPANDTEGT